VDNVSETILLRDLLLALERAAPSAAQ